MTRLKSFLLPGILAAVIPAVAFGQTAEPGGQTTAANQSNIEEITVIARGRSERLRDIPDTVTVFTSEMLETQRITTVDDLVGQTPGVFIINDQDPGTNLITIRGVSTNRQQAPSIAYVADGVQLADTELFTRPLYDLESVEILKGPQGALYGRSAIAGVFNVRSKRPTPEYDAFFDVGYGNGDTWRLESAVGGPIAGERLTFRASTLIEDSGGFIRNTFLDRKVDGFQSNNARFQLTARPSESLDINFKLSYLDEKGGAAYVSSADVTGDAEGRLAGDILRLPFGDFEGRSTREWLQLSANIDWRVGGGTLSSITAWDDYDKTLAEELDFRNDKPVTFFGFPAFPDGIQPIFQPIGIEVFTQELRYTSSDDGPFRWIVGAFFQDISRDRTDDFGPLLFGAEAPLIATDITQYAVFAQASYDITDALELTAALRYDRDERDEVTSGVDSGIILSEREANFGEWQPKLSLSYDLSDDHMIYGTAALGFKPGGFNIPPGPNDLHSAVFPEEQTLAFEVGARTRWFDDRLSADLALFYTDYDNFQNTIFLNGVNTVLSVDQVDVKGMELSLRGELGHGFAADLGFAYADSEIGTYIVPDPLGSGQMLDYTGNQTPNSPRFTLNVGGEYTANIGSATLNIRLDYQHVGKLYYEVDNVLYSPDHGWLNARVSLAWENLEVALWAKNLTDERWAISAFGQTQLALLQGLGPGGPFDSFTINRGAQYGARVKARF